MKPVNQGELNITKYYILSTLKYSLFSSIFLTNVIAGYNEDLPWLKRILNTGR